MTPTKQLNWAMIGVIVTLGIQIAVLVFWGGGMTARVVALESRTAPLADGTLARLDERTLSMAKALERIERREEVTPAG